MNVLKTLGLVVAGVSAAGKSCKALAMSGGGSKGAYEVGVLWGLLKNDPNPEKYEWDVITGVSAGSLNAAIVTGFTPGQEQAMVEYATELWQNTGSKDAYENWWFGIARGLIDKAGIYDNTNEYNLVKKIIKEVGPVKRKFAVSSVDANSGSYVVFNETLPRDEHYRAFVASTLIPAVFEPNLWNGMTLMDGGTVYNTNLVSAVERCREQVDDDSEISVDIVVCTGYDLDAGKGYDDLSTFNNYLRRNDIADYHKNIRDVFEITQAFPNVNWRHYIQPSKALAGGLKMLDFSNDTNTWPMQAIGREDGENAIKQGEGFMFKQMANWDKEPSLQVEYPMVGDYIDAVAIGQYRYYKKLRRQETVPEEAVKETIQKPKSVDKGTQTDPDTEEMIIQ